MPAPTNISFATATDLGVASTTPTTVTQDVNFGGTTYTVYFKITTPVSAKGLGVYASGGALGGGTYQPIVTLFTGPAGAPVAVTPSAVVTGIVQPVQIPVAGSTEYFIKLQSNIGNVAAANLALRVQLAPSIAVAIGDILINDDTDSLPLIVLDKDTGLVKQFINPFPAGERGIVLANGIIGVEDTAANNFKIYNADFSLRATVAFNPIQVNRSDLGHFFISVDGTPGSIKKIDQDGNVLQSWTIIGTNSFRRGLAIAPDESIAYYQNGSSLSPQPIKRWDLINDVALADLPGSTTTANYFYGAELLTLADGSLLTGYIKTSGTDDYNIRHFAADGTLLATFAYGSTAFLNRITYTQNYPTEFMAWFQPTGGLDNFQTIRVADGVTLSTVFSRQFEGGAYQPSATLTPDRYLGHSFSCPLLVALAATGAALTVVKVTDPPGAGVSFDFTTTGGLDPSTFSLMDGQSQAFADLVPGTYGVTETPVAGWTTTYDVSNADPPDAIDLAAGDDVTVTVTNTLDTPPDCPGDAGPPLQDGVLYVSPCADE